jgi:hypothetical protein
MRRLDSPAKLLGYKQLNATRGIPFSRTHLVLLSQTVAVIEAENQVIEEIPYLAHGGPDESR